MMAEVPVREDPNLRSPALSRAFVLQKEIERLVHWEKFVAQYQSIPGNVPDTRLWTIADLPPQVSVSDKIRTVNVILLPARLCCLRCDCRIYWSFSDEPDLYRCQNCFPRPPKAKESDIKLRLAVKHLEFMIRHRWSIMPGLSADEAGELQDR
jgi:hypothetical protein